MKELKEKDFLYEKKMQDKAERKIKDLEYLEIFARKMIELSKKREGYEKTN